jgi:hypothetical protein
MPNWSNNIVAVKGNTTKVINWLKTGVNIPEDVKLDNLADWLNKQKISLNDFNPMPQIFKDWDTTNQMRQFDTWFTETLFKGMGFMGEISPITLPKKVVKHFLAYARPLLGYDNPNFVGLRQVFRKINETTGGQYHKFADDYFTGVPDDIRKLIEDTYNKYCDGYQEAAKYQKETYGVVGWYDWGLQYRGTKWNADLHDWQVDVSADGKECIIYVCCETAWSMPEGWLATMQRNNDDLTFFVRGDEEAQFFNGYACARNLDEWVENDTTLYDKANDEIAQEWEKEGKSREDNEDDFDNEVWSRQQELSNEITNRFYEYVLAYEAESVSEN